MIAQYGSVAVSVNSTEVFLPDLLGRRIFTAELRRRSCTLRQEQSARVPVLDQ